MISTFFVKLVFQKIVEIRIVTSKMGACSIELNLFFQGCLNLNLSQVFAVTHVAKSVNVRSKVAVIEDLFRHKYLKVLECYW